MNFYEKSPIKNFHINESRYIPISDTYNIMAINEISFFDIKNIFSFLISETIEKTASFPSNISVIVYENRIYSTKEANLLNRPGCKSVVFFDEGIIEGKLNNPIIRTGLKNEDSGYNPSCYVYPCPECSNNYNTIIK